MLTPFTPCSHQIRVMEKNGAAHAHSHTKLTLASRLRLAFFASQALRQITTLEFGIICILYTSHFAGCDEHTFVIGCLLFIHLRLDGGNSLSLRCCIYSVTLKTSFQCDANDEMENKRKQRMANATIEAHHTQPVSRVRRQH